METFEAIKQFTPCFILDQHNLHSNITSFQNALSHNWDNYTMGYSVKTNSLPYILKQMKDSGCFAEVVSDTEYKLALRTGFRPDQIIFNGPIKSKEQFDFALKNHSVINIDSTRELDWLEEADKWGIDLAVGIRVSFDLAATCPGESSKDGLSNRFGFNLENGYFEAALKRILKLNHIRLSGLHMHTNSKSRLTDVFEQLALKACEIAASYQLKLDYVDIGGSFFVKKGDFSAYETYAKAIAQKLGTYFSKDTTRLIVEPGAAVISTPVSYLTKVIDVKETYHDHFVITDGCRLHIDPFLRKTSLDYELFTSSSDIEPAQIICGYSCMDADRIMMLNDNKALKNGDYIRYGCVGSYTMCFQSLFIEYLPYVFVEHEDHTYEMIRDKWGIEEFLQKSVY
ncbi:MAG: pyridoxal-dependent decarboxylase [Clostridia bacterium]|nr:pyridoxal-dependent decarboxylase [Clostridia bacterium]